MLEAIALVLIGVWIGYVLPRYSPCKEVKCRLNRTRRHHIPYAGNHPSMSQEDYEFILDCVYEMADHIAASNGVSVVSAIHKVCSDEGWEVDVRDRLTIRKMLTNS